ncbi:MAG TPA: hypothetical protein VNK96_09145 [Fimbriimonadales bacterium]|nr:hypothetical protein [Fimbriimonadales bacterium]
MRKKKSTKPIKVCPGCNAVNVASHDTCYRCGWKGKFYNDSKLLDSVIKNLFDSRTEGQNYTHAVIRTDK